MFPDTYIPVLQMSMPTLDPRELFELGRTLAPLRDEGTLIVGSGFTTHTLRWFTPDSGTDSTAPTPSSEFDHWAAEAVPSGDLDTLFDLMNKAPAAPAHRALGAALRRARRRQARRRGDVRLVRASSTASGTD